MSNSPLAKIIMISPNTYGKRNHAIDTITIHCFVGQVTAKRGAEVFQPKSKKASCNYVVGKDGDVALVLGEDYASQCSSNEANDQRAITIECASETTSPYAITDKCYQSLINLLVDICQRNGIKKLLWKADKSLIGQVNKQNMTVHRWFANKACPGDYIYSRLGKIAEEVNIKLKGGDEVEVYRMLEDVPDFFRPSVKKLVDNGYMVGTGGGELNVSYDFCRVFTVLDRMGLIKEKEE